MFRLKMHKKCCNRRYKLVITDIQMPEMDGFELTRRILSIQNILLDKKQRRCPVVAATAYTDPENVKKA